MRRQRSFFFLKLYLSRYARTNKSLMAIFTLLTQEMTRNEAQNYKTEWVLLTSNKNCRDINFLSVRQGQGPCLFLSDVKDSISLHNSVRYKVWNDFLSNLVTKQASFERKTRNIYARMRDAAIKRLVILISNVLHLTSRNEFFWDTVEILTRYNVLLH